MKQGKIFKNLLGIDLVKYLSKFLTHIKKHLGHKAKPTIVQNYCIKLFNFGVDITKLFLHQAMMRNISCREKFFNPKILSQVFKTNLTHFFHDLCRFISG